MPAAPHPGVAPRTFPRPRLLRLSVTDRCNFRCRYCMPAGGARVAPRAAQLPLAALADQVRWLVATLGLDRVKLTGGEPLLRPDLAHLVADLAEAPGLRELSLTTNGSGLAESAHLLRDAGLDRVTVSLDTLDPGRFAELTRGARLAATLAGIDAALAAGLTPLKLNAVLLRSTWRTEVPALLAFAAARGCEIRFIELMRAGTEAAWCSAEFVASDDVCRWLAREGSVEPIPTAPGAPARRTRVRTAGLDVVVGWISPQSHSFCGACERLRLDAQGRLRRCLMDPRPLDLAARRRDAGDDVVRDELLRYLEGKRAPAAMDLGHPMSVLGG